VTRGSVAVFLLAFGSGACAAFTATPTPYQPSGYSGGYEDQRVGDTRFQIVVRGNGRTSEMTLVGYFHRRASELCQSIGYSGYSFEVSTQTTQRQLSPKTTTVDRTYDANGSRTTIQEHPATSVELYSVGGSVDCNRSGRATAPNEPGITLQQAQALFFRLERGMTREQVAQILGPPSSVKTEPAGQDTGRPWLCLTWNYIWNSGTADRKGLGVLFADQGGWRLHYWSWF